MLPGAIFVARQRRRSHIGEMWQHIQCLGKQVNGIEHQCCLSLKQSISLNVRWHMNENFKVSCSYVCLFTVNKLLYMTFQSKNFAVKCYTTEDAFSQGMVPLRNWCVHGGRLLFTNFVSEYSNEIILFKTGPLKLSSKQEAHVVQTAICVQFAKNVLQMLSLEHKVFLTK